MKEPRICLQCNDIFLTEHKKRGEGKFCSHSCCATFYNSKRMKNHTAMFLSNIDKTTSAIGCWLYKTGGVYGAIKIKGKAKRAHRFSYEHFKGPIPEGMLVCHKCDIPRCVNPDHLFLGTPSDNMIDMHKKERGNNIKGSQCPHAKLTEKIVAEIKSKALKQKKLKPIAIEYGLTSQEVYSIKHGHSWKHVIPHPEE